MCQNADRNFNNQPRRLRAKENTMSLREWFRHRKDLLKRVHILKISSTYAQKRIASATDVFAEIEPAFNDHIAVEQCTTDMYLLAYELKHDATFREMFEWLAKNKQLNKDINALCMTQNQIVDLANKCPHWLIDSNKSAIMLFKSKDQLCVAVMSVKKEEKFRVNFFILDYPVPWLGEFHHLVIIPSNSE